MMSRRSAGVLLVFLLLLEGCGFRLRGSTEVAARYQPLYLEVLAATEVQATRLEHALGKAGVGIGPVEAGGNRLQVALSRKSDQSLSGNSSASTNLVDIQQQLRYAIVDSAGKNIVAESTISNSQTISLDKDNVLSRQETLERARNNQERALIRALLFRLRQ